MEKCCIRRFVLVGIVCLFASSAYGGTVVGSKHDLSTPGEPVCVYCHTPHNSNSNIGPLWNRAISVVTFTLYSSPTMDTSPSQPSPISLLCLGCHDGVNASVTVNGNLVYPQHDLLNFKGAPDVLSYPNCERCHPEYYSGREGNYRLGTDLSDDHPISMTYPTPAQDSNFNIPSDLQDGWGAGDVRLVDGKVECVSCHNVHDPSIPPFLVKSNAGSALCLKCHKM